MGRVTHFEITADNMDRAQKFYEIFGWDISDSGMPDADYRLAKTGTGEPGLDGAIMPRTYNPQPAIVWISVENLDDMIQKVLDAGGKMVGDRQTVPGIGETIYASDTEGNTFGMIQALPRQTP